MQSIADIFEQYEFLEGDDRLIFLIELGRELEPMPEALKTDATKVLGCQAKVWTYPVRNSDNSLHFLADSDSAIVKGIIALVLSMVQDRTPAELLAQKIEQELEPFHVEKHLTSRRTSGIPNMIALIRHEAERLAG